MLTAKVTATTIMMMTAMDVGDANADADDLPLTDLFGRAVARQLSLPVRKLALVSAESILQHRSSQSSAVCLDPDHRKVAYHHPTFSGIIAVQIVFVHSRLEEVEAGQHVGALVPRARALLDPDSQSQLLSKPSTAKPCSGTLFS
jgi:hypothetical protein